MEQDFLIRSCHQKLAKLLPYYFYLENSAAGLTIPTTEKHRVYILVYIPQNPLVTSVMISMASIDAISSPGCASACFAISTASGEYR